MLAEDATTNRMHESLVLFEEARRPRARRERVV
jgi:hypothetical protein